MDEEVNCTYTAFPCSDSPAIYHSYVYLFTSIVAIGVTLNSVTFLIFVKEARRFRHFGPFVMFLRHLSMSDLLFLVFVSFQGICRCYEIPTRSGLDACSVYMAYIFRPFCTGFYAVSVWITVTMTLERYILIKKVKTFRIDITARNIDITVMCFYIISFILHLPFFFYMELTDGQTVRTEISLTLGYQIWSWIRATLAKYVPIVLIISLNIAISIELWNARKRRIRLMAQSKQVDRKPKFTKSVPLLLGVCTTFIICNILEPVIYLDIYGPCKYESYSYQVTVLVINILETSAASTNFIFYVAFNRNFRKVLCHLLPFCGKQQVGPHSTVNEDTLGPSVTINSEHQCQSKYH